MTDHKDCDNDKLGLEAIVLDIEEFTASEVFKGKVAFMSFHIGDKSVGELWGTGGQLSFTGDCAASAKLFFDEVIELNRKALEG